MQEAKPTEAVYLDEKTGEEKACMVVNSNVLISGVRYMGIVIDGERKTVPAKNVIIGGKK
ncbi:MAG: hypothetical protein K6B44_07035 [Lachnospiraceae bacterium]|nr:hypothetical protein [Lachnospiraceae bacterium]